MRDIPNLGPILIVAFVCVLIILWAHPHWFAPKDWGRCDDETNADASTPYYDKEDDNGNHR